MPVIPVIFPVSAPIPVYHFRPRTFRVRRITPTFAGFFALLKENAIAARCRDRSLVHDAYH
jgi:hypothetical protein